MGISFYKERPTDYITVATWDYQTDPVFAEGGDAKQAGAPAADAGNTTQWGLNNQFREIADKIIDLDTRVDALDPTSIADHIAATEAHGSDGDILGEGDFENWTGWAPSFIPAAGSITNVIIDYANYLKVGKIVYYSFKARMDVSKNTAYIRCTMPVSIGTSVSLDTAMGIGVYNDGNYVSAYALKFTGLTEVYINKYDGTSLNSGSTRLVTMEGKYEID